VAISMAERTDRGSPSSGSTTPYISCYECCTKPKFTLSAAKDIDALSRMAREHVEAGLHRYAITGQGDVKALQGRDGYRLRIGSYRVIFDEDATTILTIYIGRRATTTYKRS
jgi:mRNA interferase RelE/StbE